MEHCSGGELFERFVSRGALSEDVGAKVMGKLFSAMEYLHNKGICHRDLKPENFLFASKHKDAELKVIDFGLSRKFEPNAEKKLTSVVGTPLYVAPEVLEQNYDERCDN